MQDLGIRAERAPAGLPEMRVRIERLFRTMSTSLMPLLTGRTFSDVVSKGDANPESQAALTVEEVSEALVRWIVDVYHNNPHEGLNGQTPANCWKRVVEAYGVQPQPDMHRRRVVFGARFTRKVTKKGICVLGVQYHSDALARWMPHTNELNISVRWHRDDIGAIAVNVDGEWVEVPSVLEDMRGVRAEIWHGAVRSLRASFRDEAEISRPVVLQAIRDIEAMNGAAMKRQGLIVQDFSAENLKKMEDHLMIGFAVSSEETIPEGPRWGLELGTASSNAKASVAHPDDPTEDHGGAWTNEAK
jgi:putative transposase